MNSEISNPTKVKPRILTDTLLGLSMAKSEILKFQHEVASNPEKFIQPIASKNPLTNLLLPEVPQLNEFRKKTQEQILEKICLRIQSNSENLISQKEIQAAIEEKCITRTLSILYASTYQWKDQEKKFQILQHAGESFTKDDGTLGTRAGGICHAFLRQNGLLKKITHEEMAKDIKQSFESAFQKTKKMLSEEGFSIDDSQLRKGLACELFRRTGGRSQKIGSISSAQEAAKAFCQRIIPEKSHLLSLSKDMELQSATNNFVENQIPKPLKDYLLENPLKPVYERNPQGGVLLHPDSGKPILNQELPEKWRKEEIPTTIESLFQKIQNPDKKEEIGLLLDTLRIPRKLNIPLNSALEDLIGKIPEIPNILVKAQEVEKTKMAYEIAKGVHSLAYRLGIATAAAGENLLSQEDCQTLEKIQNQINAFPENGGTKKMLFQAFQIPDQSADSLLQNVETLWRKSTLLLKKSLAEKTLAEKTPEVGTPRSHGPVFTPIY